MDGYTKDADQKRSDFYIVFTMMLCGLNLLCLESYEARIHKLAPNGFTEVSVSDLKPIWAQIAKSLINVSLNLSMQRIMVKTT